MNTVDYCEHTGQCTLRRKGPGDGGPSRDSQTLRETFSPHPRASPVCMVNAWPGIKSPLRAAGWAARGAGPPGDALGRSRGAGRTTTPSRGGRAQGSAAICRPRPFRAAVRLHLERACVLPSIILSVATPRSPRGPRDVTRP